MVGGLRRKGARRIHVLFYHAAVDRSYRSVKMCDKRYEKCDVVGRWFDGSNTNDDRLTYGSHYSMKSISAARI
jgi:hypothetical protein